MNPIVPYKPSNSTPHCADLIPMAEKEMSAFFNAVTRSFGSEQAATSAEDWLHELIKFDRIPTSPREWRSITVKVATRLARRVNASSLLAEQQIA